MKAPKCKTCGREHYGTCVGTPAQSAAAASLAAPIVRADAVAGRSSRAAAAEIVPSRTIEKPRPNGADPQAAKVKELEAEVIALRARIEEIAGENAKFKADAEATEKRRQAQRDRMRTARGGLRRAPKGVSAS